MSRLIALGILLATLSSTGCVGWGPCGNECFQGPFRSAAQGICSTCEDNCCNCDGYNPPFGNLRRTLACGSGCGEIYYGDWLSNPPNACNECDARGIAYGANSRVPWLCNWWWRPMGRRYRPMGQGYGNPWRATHPGMADYGYRQGLIPRGGFMEDPCGCSSCETGCSSGCLNGDCAPNAPVEHRLKPIPKGSTSASPISKRAMEVNYQSPLVRNSRIRTARANQSIAKATIKPRQPDTTVKNVSVAKYSRLRQQSLR